MDGTARRLGSRLPLAHEGIVRRFRSLIRGLGVSDTLPMVRRLERRSTDGGTSGGTRFRNVQKRFYYQLDNRTIRLPPLPLLFRVAETHHGIARLRCNPQEIS